MKLQISNELALPKETVTSTFVIYGGKGMGKTNLASVLCEELHRCKLRFSYLDPVGVAWGLRSSADGKSAGLEILILGGKHGDIPIDPTAGALVADFVVDENVNVIVDFSRHANGKMWGAGEKIRFVTAYTNRLFERQGEKRQPLMQIYDEAGRFVPQIIPKGAIEIAECIGAIEQLVELGRNVGIGVTLITQRSARMNKSVSELADVMIAFRTVGPRSVAAIDDWLSENIGKEERANIIDEIRSLPIGKAMIVSPGWLQIQKPVQIRPRQTFDSSATPKPGEQIKPPKKRAEIDLSKYRERMAETIARATQENPAELRKQIAQLKRELTAAQKFVPARVETQKVIEKVPIITNGELQKLEKAFVGFHKVAEKYLTVGVELGNQFSDFGQTLSSAVSGLSALLQKAVAPPAAGVRVLSKPLSQEQIQLAKKSLAGYAPILKKIPVAKSNFKFANATTVHKFDRALIKPASPYRVEIGDKPRVGIKRMVQVLAQFPDGRTDTQLRTLAFIPKPKTYETYKSEMMRRGFSEYREGRNFITAAGMSFLDSDIPDQPKSTDELLELWCGLFRAGNGKILRRIVSAYPDWVNLAEFVGNGMSEKTVATYASELKSNELAEVSGSRIKASDVFFE